MSLCDDLEKYIWHIVYIIYTASSLVSLNISLFIHVKEKTMVSSGVLYHFNHTVNI